MITPSAILVYLLSAACWVRMIQHHTAGDHSATFTGDFLAWLVMVGAMMLPTTLPAVNDVSYRTYRRRRLVAAIEYVVGYMACWGIAGAVFALLRLHPLMHERRWAALGCLLAALWAMLPVRRIWFAQCHRQIPLCPVGWRADWDAVRQGATQGIPCVKMCWLLMVACGISEHDGVMMISGTVLAFREKRMFRLNRAPIVVGSLTLAAWFLVQLAFYPIRHLPLPSHHHH